MGFGPGKFNKLGLCVQLVGQGGGVPGKLWSPYGISVSEDHFVCVCDR